MKARIDWAKHIEAWELSGLNKADYCRQNGLSSYSFYEKTRKHRQKTSNPFVELPAVSIANAEKPPVVEVHFQIPFAFRLRICFVLGGRA